MCVGICVFQKLLSAVLGAVRGKGRTIHLALVQNKAKWWAQIHGAWEQGVAIDSTVYQTWELPTKSLIPEVSAVWR